MARWKLTAKHYLPVPGTEWDYKETDATTGRQKRKVFVVPRYLDPDDPSDQNPEGLCVVTNVEDPRDHPFDIYFTGAPTPDMEPLDEEAESISAALRQKWDHPIESLPANGGMNEAEKAFMQNMMQEFAKAIGTQPQAVSAPGVSAEAFEAVKKQLEELASANAALMARLNDTPPAGDVSRRL